LSYGRMKINQSGVPGKTGREYASKPTTTLPRAFPAE